jgi:hypothetical protein
MLSVFPVLYAYHLLSRSQDESPLPAPKRRRGARSVPPGWRPLPDEDAWLLPDGSKVTGEDLLRLASEG